VATGRGLSSCPLPAGRPARHVLGVDLSMGMIQATAADLRGRRATGRAVPDGCRRLALRVSFDRVLCGHGYCSSACRQAFCRVLRPGGQAGFTIVARGCFDWLHRTLERTSPARPDEEPDDLEVDTRTGWAGCWPSRVLRRTVSEEATDFIYASDDEYWSMCGRSECAARMEEMDAATLDRFKADVFRQLQAFHQPTAFTSVPRAVCVWRQAAVTGMGIISAVAGPTYPRLCGWFVNRIQAGYCTVLTHSIPTGSRALRFGRKTWTYRVLDRNPRPLMRHPAELDARGYLYYFHTLSWTTRA